MSEDFSEFIDTYSDDLISLQEGRIAILTHPLRRTISDFCDASFARLLAVVMVASIEMMLSAWRDRDSLRILDTWFAEKASNGDRVQRLCDAFRQKQIAVDNEVFHDFLAIKYLRNTIVHTRWKKEEKKWVESRNFPGDTRKLTREHWKRMQSVNQSMMFYIGLTGVVDAATLGKIAHPVPAQRIEARDEDVSGILRKRHFPTIYWNNLERIGEVILQDIYKANSSKEYAWSAGLSAEEGETISSEQKKKLFYLSARRAGEARHPLLEQHRELAQEALAFWKDYWRLTFEREGITIQELRESAKVLRYLHQKSLYPKGPFEVPRGLPDEIARQLLHSMLPAYDPLTDDEVFKSLNAGSVAYETVPNGSAPSLFIEFLPIVDPENTNEYLMEGERALAAMELNDYWYSYVERRQSPEFDRWDFYRRMSAEFMSRSRERPPTTH